MCLRMKPNHDAQVQIFIYLIHFSSHEIKAYHFQPDFLDEEDSIFLSNEGSHLSPRGDKIKIMKIPSYPL